MNRLLALLFFLLPLANAAPAQESVQNLEQRLAKLEGRLTQLKAELSAEQARAQKSECSELAVTCKTQQDCCSQATAASKATTAASVCDGNCPFGTEVVFSQSGDCASKQSCSTTATAVASGDSSCDGKISCSMSTTVAKGECTGSGQCPASAQTAAAECSAKASAVSTSCQEGTASCQSACEEASATQASTKVAAPIEVKYCEQSGKYYTTKTCETTGQVSYSYVSGDDVKYCEQSGKYYLVKGGDCAQESECMQKAANTQAALQQSCDEPCEEECGEDCDEACRAACEKMKATQAAAVVIPEKKPCELKGSCSTTVSGEECQSSCEESCEKVTATQASAPVKVNYCQESGNYYTTSVCEQSGKTVYNVVDPKQVKRCETTGNYYLVSGGDCESACETECESECEEACEETQTVSFGGDCCEGAEICTTPSGQVLMVQGSQHPVMPQNVTWAQPATAPVMIFINTSPAAISGMSAPHALEVSGQSMWTTQDGRVIILQPGSGYQFMDCNKSTDCGSGESCNGEGGAQVEIRNASGVRSLFTPVEEKKECTEKCEDGFDDFSFAPAACEGFPVLAAGSAPSLVSGGVMATAHATLQSSLEARVARIEAAIARIERQLLQAR